MNRRRGHIRYIQTLSLLLMLFCHSAVRADGMQLLATQTATRTVFLEWDIGSGTTDIYRRFPDESQLVLIGTTEGSTWTDRHSRTICGDTVYYVVRRGGNEGAAALLVSDNEPTSPAQWGVVTVDQNSQHIKLQWTASQDTDIMGYLICEGTPSLAIDTVFGRTNTSYTYLQDSCLNVHQFKICAFDSCRQASSLTLPCSNIVVILESEPCSRSLTATWNDYQNMPSGVARYELWKSEDNGQFVLASQATGGNPTSMQFTVSDECMTVRAYIKAISTDGSIVALSNCEIVTFATSERPAYLYLRKVTVDDDCSRVTVIGETDANWADSTYRVYRSVEGGSATIVGECRPSASGQLVWSDRGVRPSDEVYTYFFGVTDGCGRNEIRSQKGSVILPHLRQNGSSYNLEWNAYEGWEGTTVYNVYYGPVEGSYWELAGTTTDNRMMNVSDDTEGPRRYKVIAYEGPDSRYKHNDSLQSATIINSPNIDVWMPNSFTPLESTNNLIGPQTMYVNPDGYSFMIYNRMGLLVFSSTTPGECWDGRYKGQLQPMGAYTYLIKYRQSDGSNHQTIGSILMIY